MKKLKVALIQYDTVNPDIEWNTTTAKRLIREASENGADLVLFPECFLTSYSVPDIVEKLLPLQEIEDHPDFIKWCKNVLTEDEEHFVQITNLAAELNIGVVITGFSKGKQYPQNTAWIIDRDGKVLLKYSKVHTCDFDWERYLESGDAFPVCQFDGITMGCMICYDREYPESARELMLNGAELIMHPNSCGGMPPRLKELSVRAMENMVGIAMANPPSEGMGNSCAFSPMVWTEDGVELNSTIFVGEELEETIYYVEFDMDEIRAYREREDLGKYRKPKAYKKLV
ncbi:MAG: carbon-nitrogen hydrolase family protein [Lachnospiraceae bacterium]|nr:carbon-nitrogen hydrolase family protein [Lachnospiraceae bacterium]